MRRAIASNLLQLPPGFRRSLTWDRGRDMAEHQELAEELGLEVYFCDLGSPWQRGSNENANRLLRQNLSKTADLRTFTMGDLDKFAHRITTLPRRVLDWATSHERFWTLLQPTIVAGSAAGSHPSAGMGDLSWTPTTECWCGLHLNARTLCR